VIRQTAEESALVAFFDSHGYFSDPNRSICDPHRSFFDPDRSVFHPCVPVYHPYVAENDPYHEFLPWIDPRHDWIFSVLDYHIRYLSQKHAESVVLQSKLAKHAYSKEEL